MNTKGNVRQEIPTPIRLYKRNELPACQDRLVRVVAGEKFLYSTCHAFDKIRRQFRKEFGCSMPGVIDDYNEEARTEFNLQEFVKMTTLDQFFWILPRLPSGLITPPQSISARPIIH